MIRCFKGWRWLVISILAGSVASAWPLSRWARARSERAEVVRIAARAYLKEFGEPAPPYCGDIPGRAAHLVVRRDASRDAYIVDFGYQFIGPDTRRDILGRPVPFASFTAFESFEVTPSGACVYLGHRSGGAY